MEKLLQDLININSLSGQELKIATYLRTYLEEKKWKVQLQKVDKDQYNLFAYWGENRNPSILFNTHLDTVPPFLPFSENDTEIWGRGACDAKCHIVTMIQAATELVAEGLEDIGLLFTIQEETDHLGIRVSNQLCLSPKCLIVGEPTDLKLIKLQKGCINGHIICKGRKVHSGYPEYGSNALAKLIDILHDIQHTSFPKSSEFGETYFNCFIPEGGGGVASNVIADYARADFNIRTPVPCQEVIRLLSEIVERVEEAELIIDAQSDPIQLDTVPGFETDVANYVTDINHFQMAISPPTLPVAGKVGTVGRVGEERRAKEGSKFIYGAGSILDAHTNHEKVMKADLTKAKDGYIQIVRALNA